MNVHYNCVWRFKDYFLSRLENKLAIAACYTSTREVLILPMSRCREKVELKTAKVLVKKNKLEFKPAEVRVRKLNLKVKSVCVRLKKLKVKLRNVKVNLKSVVLEEHMWLRNQNPVTCSLINRKMRVLIDETSPNIVDYLVKGEVTRFPICSRNPTIVPPYVSYELGSQKSIEEDDEENPTKRVPDWAQERSVMRALKNMVDPDHVFEACDPPDLHDMFPCPATTSTRGDIWDSPVQSNIIDSTYVVSEVVEESFVAEDRLVGTHNETYVVSEEYQKGRKTTVSVNDHDQSEDDDEVRFDFSIRKPVEI